MLKSLLEYVTFPNSPSFAGSLLNLKTKEGMTALLYACKCKHSAAVKALLFYGADATIGGTVDTVCAVNSLLYVIKHTVDSIPWI